MYKILRIIFCVLAVIAAAAAIFVFVYAGWAWGLITVAAACIFGAFMFLFKQAQESQELKDNPQPSKGDFITGKVTNTNGASINNDNAKIDAKDDKAGKNVK